MRRTNVDNSMYSGTACDLCGGPTLEMKWGSIWCPAEDPHRGGHFVKRVAFERAPNKGGSIESRPRVIKTQTSAPVQKVSTPKPAFGGGYDEFVGGDE